MKSEDFTEQTGLTDFPPDLFGVGADIALMMDLLARLLHREEFTILDVAGFDEYSALREQATLSVFLPGCRVITLDRPRNDAPGYVRGDSLNLPFRDKTVDFAVIRYPGRISASGEWGVFWEKLSRIVIHGIIVVAPDASESKRELISVLHEYARLVAVEHGCAEGFCDSREVPFSGEFPERSGFDWVELESGVLEERVIREALTLHLRTLPGSGALRAKLNRYFNRGYWSARNSNPSNRESGGGGRCGGHPLRRYFLFGRGFSPAAILPGWSAVQVAGCGGKEGEGACCEKIRGLQELQFLMDLDQMELRRGVADQEREIARLNALLAVEKRRTLTRGYRMLEFIQLHFYAPPVRLLRSVLGKAGQLWLVLRGKRRRPWLTISRRAYLRWIARTEPDAEQLNQLGKKRREFGVQPRFSIVAPVYNTDPQWIVKAAESVLRQVYPHWELIFVNDGSNREETREALNALRLRDERIRVRHLPENLGIAGASNHGLEMACGDFIVFMDSDDELHPAALYYISEFLQRIPNADIIFSDEDKLAMNGEREKPEFKRGWDPDYMLTYNYMNHLTTIRKTLIDRIGGFRPQYNWSQDYDLFLRATEQTDRIYHIPRVLYHWRAIPGSSAAKVDTRPLAQEKCREILEETLVRRGLAGVVKNGLRPGTFRVCIRKAPGHGADEGSGS